MNISNCINILTICHRYYWEAQVFSRDGYIIIPIRCTNVMTNEDIYAIKDFGGEFDGDDDEEWIQIPAFSE